MNRRTYLSVGTTGLVVGLAGCTATDNGSDPNPYPPYPDSETTEFSGDGETTTEPFELTQEGPMIFEVDHDGDDRFVAFMIDAETESFAQGGPTVEAVGPYRGFSIHNLPTDSYRVEIEATDEWTATVHDLPVYEDGVGQSLPIERDGELGGVIGPIDFGETSPKQFDIEFETATEANWVDLMDREGNTVGSLFEGRPTVGGSETEIDETEATHEIEVGGVGFLSVESGTVWTVSVSEA